MWQCEFAQKRGLANHLYRDVYSLQTLDNGCETRECRAEPSSPASQGEYLHTRFMSYVSKSAECHKQQEEGGDRPVCGKC